MIIMGLGEPDDAVSAKLLMDSVCVVDAELDCLSVLLSLLEDAPASPRRCEVVQGDARLVSGCSDDTELKDCIANAKLCKTFVSTARVSVPVKLLEKSLLQDFNQLEKRRPQTSVAKTVVARRS